MKTHVTWTAALLLITLAGCQTDQEPVMTDQDRIDGNRWMVSGYMHDQTQAGIVRQKTLFPYHFESGAAGLNALGQRDLGILGKHILQQPAPSRHQLNIRRGGADDELYLARVATVTEALAAAGVAAEQVDLSDDHAGGNGHSSDHVIVILERDDKQELYFPVDFN